MSKFIKIIISALFLILFQLLIFPQAMPVLTPEFLTENQWVDQSTSAKINFNAGSEFQAVNKGGGAGTVISGKYKLDETDKSQLKIYFSDYKIEDYGMGSTPDFFFGKNNFLIYRYDPVSIDYPAKLFLPDRNAFFICKSYPVKEGEERKIGDIKVITMGLKSMTATENVKLRKEPKTDAATIQFAVFSKKKPDDPFDLEFKQFLPKDTNVTILVRTEKKEKVQEWENYWYYIRYIDDESVELGSYAEKTKEAWAFSEFFK